MKGVDAGQPPPCVCEEGEEGARVCVAQSRCTAEEVQCGGERDTRGGGAVHSKPLLVGRPDQDAHGHSEHGCRVARAGGEEEEGEALVVGRGGARGRGPPVGVGPRRV